MKKTLGIIVNNYPYGYGESFLHDEVQELSKSFNQILLFIPMSSTEDKNKQQIFELPHNVSVVHINNKYTFYNKVFSFFRVGPFKLFSILRVDTRSCAVPVSFKSFKVLYSYLTKEYDFRKKLWKEIFNRSLDQKNIILYSYWFTEYTYALHKLKLQFPQLSVFTRTHGWDVYYERHNPPYLPLRKTIINSLNSTFTVSDHAKKYLSEKLSLDKPNIETFKLGVKEFPRNQFQYEKNAVNILSTAFISPIKNIELLIDALGKADNSIKINWFHIGGGNEYATVVHQYAKNILSSKTNIHHQFLGTFTTDQIKNFLKNQSIDLFINTSHDEGLPVSMMEVLSSGVPIIGPRIGGIPEIVAHKINGFLLPSKPLPEEVLSVLSEYLTLSEEEVLSMRKNAYITWQKDFNSEVNYKKLAQCLLG